MNREIRYRYVYKHKKDGDIQTEIFSLNKIENGYAKEHIGWMKKDGYKLVSRDEFTGMNDRNRKEICESDIIQSKKMCWNEDGTYSGMQDVIGKVIWEGGRFVLELADGGAPDLTFGLNYHVIIGNAWEHPHLLMGGKDGESPYRR